MAAEEAPEVLAIGFGNVGKEAASEERITELNEMLGSAGLHLTGIVRTDGFYGSDGELVTSDKEEWRGLEPNLVLVTTPSSIGEASYGYMEHYLGGQEPGHPDNPVIVTAEKGAITGFWDQLSSYIDKDLGISATVGGGTQLLKAARDQIAGGDIARIDLVVNGTLGAAMELFEHGTAAPEVARHMTALGYSEPGATDINGIFDGELGDIVKKAQIFYNYVLAEGTDYVTSGDIEIPTLSAKEMTYLITEGSRRRMVVTFIRESEDFNEHSDSPAYVDKHLPSGWRLRIAFIDPDDDPVLKSRLPLTGVDAGFVLRASHGGSDGVYSHSGPGAGPRPTARAMHADAYRLLKAKHSK